MSSNEPIFARQLQIAKATIIKGVKVMHKNCIFCKVCAIIVCSKVSYLEEGENVNTFNWNCQQSA